MVISMKYHEIEFFYGFAIFFPFIFRHHFFLLSPVPMARFKIRCRRANSLPFTGLVEVELNSQRTKKNGFAGQEMGLMGVML